MIKELKEEIKKLKELIKRKNKDICIRRVLCVLFKIEEGWNSEKIASYVGYTPSYIREIQSLYKQIGEEAFHYKPRPEGFRTHENMTLEEEKAFLDEFHHKAIKGNIIEVSSIHEAYEEKLKRKVYRSVIYDLLDRNGWRKIMPRPRHSKNNKEKMENFKKGRVS